MLLSFLASFAIHGNRATMLISCERHRPEDLELWNELEEADHLHYQRLAKSGKIKKSIAAIQEFAAHGPCYASVSWGKDSVTLAHLIYLSGCSLPLVHVAMHPGTNPESLRVRDHFLSCWPSDYQEISAHRDDFYRVLDARKQRHISGIRADESGGRKMRMRTWGVSSPSACAPLGWWSNADVFAYLAENNLPVHPSYAMLGNGRWAREHVRVDVLGGFRGDQFGRAEWEAEYFSDVINRLAM